MDRRVRCQIGAGTWSGTIISNYPSYAIYLDNTDIKHSKSIVGALMYLVNTKGWDIGFAMLELTRGMAHPTQQHMVESKQVLLYLKREPDLPTI